MAKTANKTIRKKRSTSPASLSARKKSAAAKGVPAKTVRGSVVKSPSKTRTKTARKPSRPAGLPERMRDAALKVLDERQAEDIVTVDLVGQSSIADYLIIASGRAARQVAAIAHYLQQAFAALGVRQTRVEGLPDANWVLVDAGDIIIHLFRPEVRHYYHFDDLWRRDGKAA